MKKKILVFSVDTLEKAENIILENKNYNSKPIFFIKNYLIRGFGSDFINIFRDMLISKFGKTSFKLFVDCGYDHGLSIDIISKKIEYIKLKGNTLILSKIKNIAGKNRVLLNPPFDVVDFRNIKNIKLKLRKIYFKEKNEN